jgi:ABC-type transport system involved in cytochrome c biogenesis permease subunit
MKLTFSMLALSGLAYLAAFGLHIWSFRDTQEKSHRPGFMCMQIGFLIGTFYFAADAVVRGVLLPVTGLSPALAFFAWSLAFVYLVLLARVQSDSFGLILTPALFGLTLASALTFQHGAAQPFELGKNPLFIIHILSAFFAYASLTISFAAGVLYLIQNHQLKSKTAGTFYHKLPALEELEKLISQPMIWGASLLLAAVLLGLIWSKVVYGELWIADPNTIASSVTVLIYFAILILRYTTSLRAKRGAVLALAAFLMVLFSFVGTRFIEGSHNYLK